jgi:hypothetical protein
MKRRGGSLLLFSGGAASAWQSAIINQRLHGSPLVSDTATCVNAWMGQHLPNIRLYSGWLVSAANAARPDWPRCPGRPAQTLADVPDRSALAIVALFVLVLWSGVSSRIWLRTGRTSIPSAQAAHHDWYGECGAGADATRTPGRMLADGLLIRWGYESTWRPIEASSISGEASARRSRADVIET